MSTEKLSKPVAWIIGEESIEEFKRGYETFVVRGDDVDSTEETMKFYSQEYVSALLADLEAKDKRIAELEAKTAMTMGVGSGNGNLFVHGDYDSIKAAQAIVLENESLRAKLAAPVRLVAYRNSPDMHTKQYYEAIGFNQGIDSCCVAVRAAGFTVEGDEQ
ncbi:hypothetical protein SM12BL3_14180 [Serratia marcescens]|nr:hypothetical protein SM12BL3_14180 [Serratia marcescens]